MKQIQFGNLLDTSLPVYKDNDYNIIVHGCNAQGVMGSGVALGVKQKWPGAFEEYHAFVRNFTGSQSELLGKVIPYAIEEENLLIANAITQVNFGKDGKRYVSYSAVNTSFNSIAQIASGFRSVAVHYPLIGAGLGGGDWAIISDIIDVNMNRYPHLSHYLWILE
jgi:O-acetyl-ADP-ribose deacetylase (regulator of RNase III)